MNIDTVKGVVTLVSTIGTGAVVANIVKATTPETVTRLGRISIKIGTVVICGMVGEMTAKYATGEVDRIHTWLKEVTSDKTVEAK